MYKYNEMALAIAEQEGKEEGVNIAQIREILSITLDMINRMTTQELAHLLATRPTKKKNDVPILEEERGEL